MDSESACGDMIWPPSVWTMDYARDLPMAVGRAGLDVEEGRGTAHGEVPSDDHNAIATAASARAARIHTTQAL